MSRKIKNEDINDSNVDNYQICIVCNEIVKACSGNLCENIEIHAEGACFCNIAVICQSCREKRWEIEYAEIRRKKLIAWKQYYNSRLNK